MQYYNHIENLKTPAPQFLKNEEVDEILRGEISAFEAYEQVMEKFSNHDIGFNLKLIRDEHRRAIKFWESASEKMGKIPEDDSHLWGSMVETFVGVSKMIGDSTALKALRTGEEHGLNNYQKMLTYSSLGEVYKNKIRDKFIPMQQKHIEILNKLIESV